MAEWNQNGKYINRTDTDFKDFNIYAKLANVSRLSYTLTTHLRRRFSQHHSLVLELRIWANSRTHHMLEYVRESGVLTGRRHWDTRVSTYACLGRGEKWVEDREHGHNHNIHNFQNRAVWYYILTWPLVAIVFFQRSKEGRRRIGWRTRKLSFLCHHFCFSPSPVFISEMDNMRHTLE